MSENIVKKVCKELGITQKEFQNLLRVEQELPPLLKSLKIIEFELRHFHTDSPLYLAIKQAKEEVEKVVMLNHRKAVATLLDAGKSSVSHHLGDRNSRTQSQQNYQEQNA